MVHDFLTEYVFWKWHLVIGFCFGVLHAVSSNKEMIVTIRVFIFVWGLSL